MPLTEPTDFAAILRVLSEYKVDFIVVGGVAAVLEGAPMTTFDLDVVHSREVGNISRLLEALVTLDAWYRMQPERGLRSAESHLLSPGHQLLLTRFGPLDLQGAIGRDRAYEDLVMYSSELLVEDGVTVKVLNLETLIEVKEETAGDKDRAALPLLRRTLELKNR